MNHFSFSNISVPPALNKVQIVIIISSLGSLLLLGGVIVIVLKCRRKRRTQGEDNNPLTLTPSPGVHFNPNV